MQSSQGSVAQLVEQRTSNPKVVGSNPTWATEFFNNSVGHYQCRLSSLLKISDEIRACDLGQNLIMTKTA